MQTQTRWPLAKHDVQYLRDAVMADRAPHTTISAWRDAANQPLGMRQYSKWMSGKLSRGISPTDIDFLIEVGGRFLCIEFKPEAEVLAPSEGQLTMLRAMSRLPEWTVLIVGDYWHRVVLDVPTDGGRVYQFEPERPLIVAQVKPGYLAPVPRHDLFTVSALNDFIERFTL